MVVPRARLSAVVDALVAAHPYEDYRDSYAARADLGGGVLRLGLIPLLGLGIWQIVVYELLVVAITQFHHANISLDRFDRWLRLVIVTPDMHKVHHSRWRPETDSNYSTVLSIWDRLAWSFRMRANVRTLELGLLAGTPGLAALTLGVSALTAGLRRGGALAGLLMLPLAVPLIAAGVQSMAVVMLAVRPSPCPTGPSPRGALALAFPCRAWASASPRRSSPASPAFADVLSSSSLASLLELSLPRSLQSPQPPPCPRT